MNDYIVSEIRQDDRRGIRQMELLLEKEGISRDGNLDYSVGIFDEDYHLIATGSCFKNTLRCMAVDSYHQGEGLLNSVVSHLITHEYERGYFNLFLYTKCDSAKFFGDLGFYEISRVEDRLVFMENRRTGFSDYLDALRETAVEGRRISAIVMNANPFTKGHRYLVERAAAESDHLHLFMVSEDASLIPFAVRERLIREGTADLRNISYHKTGDYMISNATFPSYFLKDSELVIRSHAQLDVNIFKQIAEAMNIRARYVGDEPRSRMTGIYNEIMRTELPKAGIDCRIIQRLEAHGEVISASTVRQALAAGDHELLRTLVPRTTLEFFESTEARDVIKRIRAAEDLVHH